MNPDPVPGSDAVPAYVEDRADTALRRTRFCSRAGLCALPPHWLKYAGTGSTQKMSDQVSSALFPSAVCVWSVPPKTKDESVKIPQDARSLGLKETRTRCVTSTTESIAPFVPQ